MLIPTSNTTYIMPNPAPFHTRCDSHDTSIPLSSMALSSSPLSSPAHSAFSSDNIPGLDSNDSDLEDDVDGRSRGIGGGGRSGRSDNILSLPFDVAREIFLYLDTISAVRSMLVCSSFWDMLGPIAYRTFPGNTYQLDSSVSQGILRAYGHHVQIMCFTGLCESVVISAFEHCPNLQHLVLDPWILPPAYRIRTGMLQDKFPKLRSIGVENGYSALSFDDLTAISRLPNLESIGLSGLAKHVISDEQLSTMLRRDMPRTKSIALSGVSFGEKTDAVIAQQFARRLQVLRIADMNRHRSRIFMETVGGGVDIMRQMCYGQLHTLELKMCCVNRYNQCVITPQYFPKLRHLYIQDDRLCRCSSSSAMTTATTSTTTNNATQLVTLLPRSEPVSRSSAPRSPQRKHLRDGSPVPGALPALSPFPASDCHLRSTASYTLPQVLCDTFSSTWPHLETLTLSIPVASKSLISTIIPCTPVLRQLTTVLPAGDVCDIMALLSAAPQLQSLIIGFSKTSAMIYEPIPRITASTTRDAVPMAKLQVWDVSLDGVSVEDAALEALLLVQSIRELSLSNHSVVERDDDEVDTRGLSKRRLHDRDRDRDRNDHNDCTEREDGDFTAGHCVSNGIKPAVALESKLTRLDIVSDSSICEQFGTYAAMLTSLKYAYLPESWINQARGYLKHLPELDIEASSVFPYSNSK
ncbi:hypothetical protein GQ42DRAFT_87422 [Ramicandelaber brevisporus]|nr:hypothetical protein GQ42DRAFT_87422 [Ramicandelaber brevisporus]